MSSGGRYQRVITYSVMGSVFSSSPPTPDAIRANPKSHTFKSQFLFTSRLLRAWTSWRTCRRELCLLSR
eukprot:COSAG02_NODE_1578_length_11853_cov_3.734048_6_plen_69_part_00